MAVVQVPIETCLVDRVDRPQTHRHGGKLPKVTHEMRMGVTAEAPADPGGGIDVETKTVEVDLIEAALQVRPGVDAR